eukprot:CAMPEP_0119045370 /NCGR_PEP_ID=MMETSP1177-20130426/39224_1 /TAXON_ID=2985 /ORGANISM="Ochromonas sp, Strain CCMP1899" /LENGTH=474 /DNA_ID=CAMNT_0007017009 /DNA_START=447 /DNA_END=1868 /DNA_ORIENTATION=-
MVGLDIVPEKPQNDVSIWGGVTATIEKSNHHIKPDLNLANKNNSVNYWTDFLQQNFHSKSICEMPIWTNNQNFDTFFSGSSVDLVPNDVKEDFTDRFRYFAEECDHVACIRVLADLHNGFGGLTCSIVEEFREEYPSVAIPVWAFTEPFSNTESDETESYCDTNQSAPTTSSSLRSLGVPLAYSKLSENASIIIPIGDTRVTEYLSQYINIDGKNTYQSSSILALAIEAAEGHQHLIPPQAAPSERSMGPQEWCYAATKAGRFPLCALEGCLYPLGKGPTEPLMDSFNINNNQISTSSYTTLNPFTQSLSAARYGSWSINSNQRKHRAYSNLLSIRGVSKDELFDQLYEKCIMSSYMITACHQRQTPLLLSTKFPSVFTGLSPTGLSIANPAQAFGKVNNLNSSDLATSVDSCAFIASVGCDSSMGEHVRKVAETWNVRSPSVNAQISKVGMGPDESGEILESLMDMVSKYELS